MHKKLNHRIVLATFSGLALILVMIAIFIFQSPATTTGSIRTKALTAEAPMDADALMKQFTRDPVLEAQKEKISSPADLTQGIK